MKDKKQCSRCKTIKDLSDFAKRKISADGHEGVCRQCRSEAKRKWYANNRERYRETNKEWYSRNRGDVRNRQKKWYEENKDKLKEYRIKNSELLRAKARDWQRKNPARCVANVSARRAAKAKCTPAWLTEQHLSDIRRIYSEARKKTADTGIAYEVDHIIPISHPSVCGLHVPWNLQILSAEDNRRKSNSIVGL